MIIILVLFWRKYHSLLHVLLFILFEIIILQNHTHNELARVYNAHRQNLDLLAGPEEQLLAALPSLNIIDCEFSKRPDVI